MQRRVLSPRPSSSSASLQRSTAVPGGFTVEEWVNPEGKLFRLPSQPLSWLSAYRLTGPPGRKPNVLSLLPLAASVYATLRRPTRLLPGGTPMLHTPPRRPHLKTERLYWYLSVQVQCVPTSTQAGKASWGRRQAQGLRFLAHTYKEMNKL